MKDVEDIVAFIARDSDRYAIEMHERIVTAVDRLELFPESGWMIEELGGRLYREIVEWPYRIVHRVDQDCVYIGAVVHGAQNLKRAARSRGIR